MNDSITSITCSTISQVSSGLRQVPEYLSEAWNKCKDEATLSGYSPDPLPAIVDAKELVKEWSKLAKEECTAIDELADKLEKWVEDFECTDKDNSADVLDCGGLEPVQR